MAPLDDIQKKLASADEEERRIAVRSLAALPLPDARELAFASLGDESWRVRKEAVELILSFRADEGLISDLVDLLSVQGNAGLRNSVVEILQATGEKALPKLVASLGHEDPGVRKFLVDIMGGIGSASVVPELCLVLDDEDANVAAAAAESLGLIGDSGSLPHLLKALERDDLLIRYAILEALVKIGSPVPLQVITPLAGDPLLKRALFDCLGIIGSPEAVSLLIEGLGDRARKVREAALVALDLIRRRSVPAEVRGVIDPLLRSVAGTEPVEYLLAVGKSQDRKIKNAAIAILGAIGDLRAVDLLLDEYRNEEMQSAALQALRDMGNGVGRELEARFENADTEGRCVIVHMAGELDLPESRRIAENGTADQYPMVRAFAAEAIGKIEAVELISIVTELLGDVNGDVRRRATGAMVRLAKVASESVAAAASRLGESGDPDSRIQGVRLYAALNDSGHIAFMLKDEEAAVRREAVNALAELRSAESAGRLTIALSDEDGDVRLAAATALGWSGFADDAGALLLALDDPSPRVQIAALKSLGRRRQLSALEKILAMLEESSGMLLISAMRAAVQIDPVKARPYLLKAEESGDEEVVKVARELVESLQERV